VAKLYYPGLPSHPQHELACRQMTGFGGMISLDLGEVGRARRFVEATRIFALAESLGGVESLIGHPASMTHASVPKALREEIGLPIHFHTHDSSGVNSASVLEAGNAGVDIVDLAIASMSGSTSQPNLNSLVAALQNTPRDTLLDLHALNEFSDYWERVRECYKPFDTSPASGTPPATSPVLPP
jgi:hypothetical protein